jgi:hypothetical protein
MGLDRLQLISVSPLLVKAHEIADISTDTGEHVAVNLLIVRGACGPVRT